MNCIDIPKYVLAGKKDINWYPECATVFKNLFGEQKLKLVCQLFAATSINTSMKSNITLFRRAYYELENNLPVGNYLPNIQTQLNRIREGKELSGRKINSFARAMYGDPEAVVVDIWLMRAFNINSKRVLKSGRVANSSPTKKQYDFIENWVREEAKNMGIQPRQLSSMIWAGARISQSGDRETHYKTILSNKLNNLFGVI
jgi:hypothetical protein